MLKESDIQGCFGGVVVRREYPPSGQKKVFLVDHRIYGTAILNVVSDASGRVGREIDIVTEFSLNNVPRILAVETIVVGDTDYLAILEEYIEGQTLAERLAVNKLTTKEGISLLKTLLELCARLEDAKVVHRDIKPSNIICHPNGDFFVIDFGIARRLDKVSLTVTHAAVGPHTPGYGAPELFQYSKKDIDSRSDLFSIGVVVFEALAGEHPFIVGDEMHLDEIWYKTKTTVPKTIIIAGDQSFQLIGFLQTLMQKHVTRRPPTANRALQWFQALLPTVDIGGA